MTIDQTLNLHPNLERKENDAIMQSRSYTDIQDARAWVLKGTMPATEQTSRAAIERSA